MAVQLGLKPEGRVSVEDGLTAPLAKAENCRMELFPLRGVSRTKTLVAPPLVRLGGVGGGGVLLELEPPPPQPAERLRSRAVEVRVIRQWVDAVFMRPRVS
jgi:hypothetical protein